MARKLRQIERLDFSRDEATRVVEYMSRLAAAGDGWINLIPKVQDDDDRPTSLKFFTLFGGGGNGMSMGTWIPARFDRGGSGHPSLGINHLVGTRIVAKLPSLGLAVPAGWFVEQDHPRRGLVLRLPLDAANEEVLSWAMRVVTALDPPRQSAGWRADIYLPNI